ncbi:MAG: outer membrane beta-barrel protein, partial [Thermoguttaceae bacterium]
MWIFSSILLDIFLRDSLTKQGNAARIRRTFQSLRRNEVDFPRILFWAFASYFLFASTFVLFSEASDLQEGPLLNPAEEMFDQDSSGRHKIESSENKTFSKNSRFSERASAPTAIPTIAKSPQKSSAITQTSAADPFAAAINSEVDMTGSPFPTKPIDHFNIEGGGFASPTNNSFANFPTNPSGWGNMSNQFPQNSFTPNFLANSYNQNGYSSNLGFATNGMDGGAWQNGAMWNGNGAMSNGNGAMSNGNGAMWNGGMNPVTGEMIGYNSGMTGQFQGGQWNPQMYASQTGMQYGNQFDSFGNQLYGQQFGGQQFGGQQFGGQQFGGQQSGDLFANSVGMASYNDSNASQYAMLQAMLIQENMRRESEAEREKSQIDQENAKKEETDSFGLKNLMPLQVKSPLGETVWSGLKIISPFNTPTGPDRGVGMPLANRSWLDRPYYVGGFIGSIWGSQLVSNMIDQKSGGMGGLIFGYNMSEYWGLESRLHFSSIEIKETAEGERIFKEFFPNAVLTTRSNQLSVFDVSVHYYPLGNAKFRPYFKYGLGFARENFVDTLGTSRKTNTLAMPIGVGLRYWWNERLAFHGDIIDNLIFAGDVTKTQNNWAFTVGLTYSFGTSKTRRPVT